MKMTGLERIIALPEVSSIISRFADSFDSSFAVKDKDCRIVSLSASVKRPLGYLPEEQPPAFSEGHEERGRSVKW